MKTIDLGFWAIVIFYYPSGYNRFLNWGGCGLWRFKVVWGPGQRTPRKIEDWYRGKLTYTTE